MNVNCNYGVLVVDKKLNMAENVSDWWLLPAFDIPLGFT